MSSIPSIVSDSEKIVRGIFHPSQVNKNTGKINNNLFNPPSEQKGVSVIRLDYSNIQKAKQHCKTLEVTGKKEYYGFALINAVNIRQVIETWTSDVESTPINNLSYLFEEHADILFYENEVLYIKKSYETIPSEIKVLIEKFRAFVAYLVDTTPDEISWGGPEIK